MSASQVGKRRAVEVARVIDGLGEYGSSVDEVQLQSFVLQLLHSIEFV